MVSEYLVYGAFFASAPLAIRRCDQYAAMGTPVGTFTALFEPAYLPALPPAGAATPAVDATRRLPFQTQIIELRNSLATALPASTTDLQVKWGDGVQRKLQERLNRAALKKEALDIRVLATTTVGLDRNALLTFDAALKFGAGAFMDAHPCKWAGGLKNEEMSGALRRRMRLPFEELFRRGGLRCTCCAGHPFMDVYGDHAEMCGREATAADCESHDLVRDALEARFGAPEAARA